MAKDNYFRSGDQVANLTGVLGYSFGSYRLQPTTGADHTASNPRPPVPEKQGNLRGCVIQCTELLHHSHLG